MPTETFFRLPEEKRERITRAAWDEFTRVSFAQVSINRIIRAADIPRGSFYQYFADKDDLFLYLARGMKGYALDGYLTVLRESGGDMFRAAVAAFDGVRTLQGTPIVEPIDRCMAFVRINPGLDFQKVTAEGSDGSYLDPVWAALDTSRLRRQEQKYTRTCFHLCLLTLGNAVLDSLAHPERWDINRAWLLDAIGIIQQGSLAPETASAE